MSDPLSVYCPHCMAKIGAPCVSTHGSGSRRHPHVARYREHHAAQPDKPGVPSCQSCMFARFVTEHNTKRAECRHNPPTVDEGGAGVFPTMALSDWCGQFRRADG